VSQARALLLLLLLGRQLLLPLQQHIDIIMGGQLSKAMRKLFSTKEMRVLMLGLDGAGTHTYTHER